MVVVVDADEDALVVVVAFVADEDAFVVVVVVDADDLRVVVDAGVFPVVEADALVVVLELADFAVVEDAPDCAAAPDEERVVDAVVPAVPSARLVVVPSARVSGMGGSSMVE